MKMFFASWLGAPQISLDKSPFDGGMTNNELFTSGISRRQDFVWLLYSKIQSFV